MSTGCGNTHCHGTCYTHSMLSSEQYIPVTVVGTAEKVRIISGPVLVCCCCGAVFNSAGTRFLGMTNGGKQPCASVGERDNKVKIQYLQRFA